MQILTRRVGETIKLRLSPNAEDNLSAADLFSGTEITFGISRIRVSNSVQVSIDAPIEIDVLRSELIAKSISPDGG